MMNKLLTFEKKEYLCKVICQNLYRMELKTLIAEFTNQALFDDIFADTHINCV